MKLIRSWPLVVPKHRAHVVDDIERFEMGDYCYRRLADYGDDILLIEWDTAVGAEDLARFRQLALANPTRVVVAPYKVYESTTRPVPLPGGPRWVHRKYCGPPGAVKQRVRHVNEQDATADLWGLGLTYLPAAVIKEFCEFTPGSLTDGSVSGWYYDHYGPADIAWDVRPVHLHYTIGAKV